MEIYIVQTGDTIDEIANQFGIPVDQLIRDNELEYPGQLIPGEVILILYPIQTYTVQEGDTLETIAATFNISVSEILRNNPFVSDEDIIYEGELLYISFDRSSQITTYGYTNTFIDREILRKTLPFLTYLSVYNYIIGENGDALGSDDDLDIVQLAQLYGAIPLMHLAAITVRGEFDISLTYDLLNDEEMQDSLFENVINILKTKGYYGVIISAQYITSENQHLFYNYTRRFSERIGPEGYLTVIAINPKINTFNNQVIYEDIDYSMISSVVSDVIFLQYTWGALETPPSPVIPVSDLNVFLDYAQTQMESDKIVIGIPVIGYIWELPYVRGLSSSSSITRDNVLSLARDVGATIQYDEASQNPYYIFEANDGNNTHYIVWFVNGITIDALLSLITERGISATGVWNIMSYFAHLWTIINSQYEIIKLLPEL